DFTIPYQHLTQKDTGWQKNPALNRAIRASKTGYLIFIDGDCVLHPKFIEHHLKMASEQVILAGKRVKLGPKFSEKLLNEDVQSFSKSYLSNYSKIKKEGGQFCEEGIFIPYNSLTSKLIKALGISSIKGCNFSCYKSAIETINGFDEDYTLPAVGEDIDLVWRFKGLEFRIVSVRHFAVQYHLHHKESWTDQTKNLAIMREKMAQKIFRCYNGLNKLNND